MRRIGALPLIAAAVLLLLSLQCSAQLLNSTWPEFRHDSSHIGRASIQGPSSEGVVWSQQVGAGLPSPAVGTNAIYVVAGGNLIARSFAGDALWAYPIASTGRSSPAIDSNGTVYIASTDGYLYAIRTSDGTVRWRKSIGGASDASPTIGLDGTIYIGSNAGRLYAFSSNGNPKFTYPASTAQNLRPITSSAAVVNSTVYFGCDDGNLYAVDLNGVKKWSFTEPNIGSIKSSPTVALDGTIYFGTTGFYTYAVYPNGTKRWACTTGPTYSSPAIGADGTIYIGTQNNGLCAINTVGGIKWKYTDGGSVDSSPAIDSDGRIYFGCADGTVRAVDSNGLLLWSHQAGSGVYSSPAIGPNRTLYILTTGGELLCLGSDTTPPTIPVVTDDGAYSPGVLHASWTCSDPESGISRYEYAIGTSPNGQDLIPFTDIGTATQVTRTDLPVVQAQVYYFTVRATNGANLTGLPGSSDGIKVDLTPPSIPTVLDSGQWFTNTTLSASWSSSDAESGIARYEYAVGTTSGAQDIVLFTDAGASTSITRADLTLGNGQAYYFTVRAINGAGTPSGAGVSDGITLDNTPPPTPTVQDDGAYTVRQNQLHASWTCTDPESGVTRYKYAIGTSPGAQDLVPYTDAGTALEVTRSDLTLTDGAKYYFSVRATNAAGLTGESGTSDGIMVDYSPPTTPVVMDDGKYTGSSDTLHFVYGSGDTESGVDHFEYSIGSGLGLIDILAWQNAGMIKEQTISGLSLSNAVTYYINVRAYNRAGLMSEGSSNGILADLTAPPAPGVAVTSASTTEIRANITASDPESGISNVQYALLDSPTLPPSVQWIDSTPGSQIVITGQFDLSKKYYLAARACNSVNLWSDATIVLAVTDQTPPTTPVVTDDGIYWSDPTTLHAIWSADDPESGIASYSYCVGNAPGLSNIVRWTGTTNTGATISGLNLTNGGKYYISVKAINKLQMESLVGSSDGITIDTTPPSPPVVTDDGDVTSVSDSLHAAFSASDAESGIAEYLYCIGTAQGLSDVVPWTSTGSTASATAYNLTLTPGVRYYFSAKARNCVGKWSSIAYSDGIEYRAQLSVWPKFRCNSSNTGVCATKACSTGRLNWRLQTQGYIESSPAIGGDGTTYIGSSDGCLYAVSPNGTIRWSYPTGGSIDSSPAIGRSGEIYVGSYDSRLYCVQPNGMLEWTYTAGGMIWSSPNIGPDGTIYFGCQDGYFYAVKPDGTLKWRYNAGNPVWSSPALNADGSVIYFACGNGKLYALNSTGTLKWQFLTGTAADSSPAVAGSGVIYFGSGDGYFYAVNPNGTPKWRVFTGNLVDSSPAIASDGTVYIGTGGAGITGTFRAFSQVGVELWKLNLTGGVRSSPAIDGRGNIYFGSSDSKVHAVKPDGSTLWTYSTGQSVLSSPAIGPDGQIVVGSDDGRIYCFKDCPEDATPPSVPVVTPTHAFISLGSALDCKWSSTDLESGIEGYSYAIGTQLGSSDIVAWTDAGSATSISRTDLSLAVGQSYYVSVKARNNAGLVSGVGTSSAITVIPDNPGNLIGAVKKRPADTRVYLPGKIVTAVFSDCVFIEEPDRSAAIRCMVPSSDLQIGAVVDALGKIALQNGEVVLTDVSLDQSTAAAAIDPVGMSIKTLMSVGIDTRGLLVRIAGKVTRTGAYYFILSDGSKVTSPRGIRGIEVRCDASSIPAAGTLVVVTGMTSIELVSGLPTTIIRAVCAPQVMSAP